jgi:hypothetical protein
VARLAVDRQQPAVASGRRSLTAHRVTGFSLCTIEGMATVELRLTYVPDATVYEDGTERRAEVYQVEAITDYDNGCFAGDDDDVLEDYRVLWSWTPDWTRKRRSPTR